MRQLYRQVLLRARISYGDSVCPSVCLYVRPSPPGTDSRPGEIETHVTLVTLVTLVKAEQDCFKELFEAVNITLF